jgi:predicted ATP-grasp superfamily ATP-dependent carboligase
VKILSPQPVLYALAGRGAFSMALQEVPPVVAIVRETVRFPADSYQPQILIAVDNLP